MLTNNTGASKELVGLLLELFGETLQERGSRSLLELREFVGFVAGVLRVDQLGQQEFLKFRTVLKNSGRRQRRPEERDVVARGHAHFVPERRKNIATLP